MSNTPQPVVTASTFLTLHYRLSTIDGQDIVSTFNENPATLQVGSGQLAPFLESRLIGLCEGAHQSFDLTSEEAFGPRNPDLLQRVSLSTLQENSDPDHTYEVGDLVDFAAPGGGQFAGVLLEMGEQDALFDFNHPLAGQAVKFEVRIIGVL
ncbi:SlpA FKBP-type peptidyl-prolyl cis-trans isomerases 2 [Oxalobacteraceae bacterium]